MCKQISVNCICGEIKDSKLESPSKCYTALDYSGILLRGTSKRYKRKARPHKKLDQKKKLHCGNAKKKATLLSMALSKTKS
jgi:hypothetical protein